MLEYKYDWKISNPDKNGNVYYHFQKMRMNLKKQL